MGLQHPGLATEWLSLCSGGKIAMPELTRESSLEPVLMFLASKLSPET